MSVSIPADPYIDSEKWMVVNTEPLSFLAACVACGYNTGEV